ncbi:MAG TPA: ribosome assembly factor SBDS, partial [Candidatus Nanoarchaeia archaeon]|nr:ribosome assembly factor SBDS [Candidatus Nanoarchaeia archaeon]
MPKVEARIKIKGQHYEISVNLDEALKVKAGKGEIMAALDSPHIYHDVKTGEVAAQKDLMDAFGTADVYEIARKIITAGEVQKTQEFRDAERETRIKQLITLVLKNAVDQHGRPYTEERIRRAMEEIHYHVDNRPADQQLAPLVEKLKEVIPIKVETKRIRLVVPARFTGQVYGLLKNYKESEEWLANGDLAAIVNIPAGLQLDFYDKLNNVTHGAIQSQDL